MNTRFVIVYLHFKSNEFLLDLREFSAVKENNDLFFNKNQVIIIYYTSILNCVYMMFWYINHDGVSIWFEKLLHTSLKI